jgi:RES domain-containing protein
MMSDVLTVWRIVHEAYLDSAFSGIGAELYGGRFNSPGHKAVYTSGSLSLAVLEMLIQAGARHRLREHWCIPASIPTESVHRADTSAFPSGWDAIPYGRASQHFGDRWIAEGSGVALAIPSVVIPQEWNYLLNPLHSAFERMTIGEPVRIPIDNRLIDQATAAAGTPRTSRSRRSASISSLSSGE